MKMIKIGIANGLVASIATMSILACYGVRDFKEAVTSKVEQAAKTDTSVVQGKDGWLFSVPELRHLSVGKFWGGAAPKVSKAKSADSADPLTAMLDFKDQLDQAGIQLLVVPVPAKAAIYPDMLVTGAANSETARLDSADAEFISLLKQKGFDVLDLVPTFLQYRADHPNQPLYSKEDSHWSGYGIDVASDLISAQIKKETWFGDVSQAKKNAKTDAVSVTGDLAGMLKNSKPGPEDTTLTSVSDPTGAPVHSWRKSPVVLIGDSNSLIYSIGGDMLASGSGLPENLALKLGFATDVVATKTSGATPSRQILARRGDDMAGKKIVVWCFSVREFTEALQGWRNVPVINR